MLIKMRSSLVAAQVACSAAVVLTLLVGFTRFSSLPSLSSLVDWVPTSLPGAPAHQVESSAYVDAILRPESSSRIQLKCPELNVSRYGYLRGQQRGQGEEGAGQGGQGAQGELKYFFALDLANCVDVLPRLLGSVLAAVRFLGPSVSALSIVEGNSRDGTGDVLEALKGPLRDAGIRYFLQHSNLHPRKTAADRIQVLATLRNMALAPLIRSTGPASSGDGQPPAASRNTTVVFINDVALCPDDMLELLHQRVFQEAEMTCGMDWLYPEHDHAPVFYDSWVARTIQGDAFFAIPPDGDWSQSWNLLGHEPASAERYAKRLPFQVFACWNGVVAFGAAPVLGLGGGTTKGEGNADSRRIAFRAARDGECQMGEPTLFCKDLWHHGFGRIAVVPSVNVEYSDGASKKTKELKGFATNMAAQENVNDTRIQWQKDPPRLVKCMPTWQTQSWVPWNESLPDSSREGISTRAAKREK